MLRILRILRNTKNAKNTNYNLLITSSTNMKSLVSIDIVLPLDL